MSRSQVQESVERVLRVKEKYDLRAAGRH
jgi:hypothetical protein